MLNINLLGAMRINKIFFPMVKKSKGCLLHITSIAGRVSVIGSNDAYGISKQGISKFPILRNDIIALITYCNFLRRELYHTGVRVLCIEPGPVRTELAINAMDDMTTFEYNETQFEKMFKGLMKKIQNLMKFRLDAVYPMHIAKVDNPFWWRHPHQVAEVIVHNMFNARVANPHIVVDNPIMKFGVIMVSILPYAWQVRSISLISLLS